MDGQNPTQPVDLVSCAPTKLEGLSRTVVTGTAAGNVGWSILRNTAAQVAGRNFIALARLVIASLIARSFGKDMFGEYSLVLALLFIAEWVLDFGTTDVFVRDICREPERAPHLLRMMTAAKALQIPAACAVLVAIVFALQYPARIVEAALVGGASMIFFGGVLVYRVVFRATLAIEREIAAETLSVLTMIALIAAIADSGAGLTAIFACHLVSRVIFFGSCVLFERDRYWPSIGNTPWSDVRWSLQSSAAMGLIGFLVVIYETLDLLMLSRLGSLSDLAYYSGAQRFVWPAVVALTAIGATLYPVASSYWPRARREFEETCQRGMDAVMLLAGLVACPMLAGAGFLMSLLGPELGAGAPVLQVLAIVCFMKAVTTMLGPLLYVVHAQTQALKFVGVALVAKAGLTAILAPRFGSVGVACGTIAADLWTAVSSVYLLRKYTGYQIRWATPLKAVVIALAAGGISRLLLPANGLLEAAAAPAIYVPLAFLSGAVRISELRSLLAWKTS